MILITGLVVASAVFRSQICLEGIAVLVASLCWQSAIPKALMSTCWSRHHKLNRQLAAVYIQCTPELTLAKIMVIQTRMCMLSPTSSQSASANDKRSGADLPNPGPGVTLCHPHENHTEAKGEGYL